MITDNGKIYIVRYLAGHVPAIASCIAYGIGDAAASGTDDSLQFEIGRSDVTLVSPDFVNNRLIFKAVLPNEFAANVREVALFSQMENPLAGNYASKVLASFDSDSEDWQPGSFAVDPAARLGADALKLTTTSGGIVNSVLNGVLFDLSGNSGADVFKFAYNVADANTSYIEWRFQTDASNFYSYRVTNPSAGYAITSVAKGNLTVTGAPSWGSITGINVLAQAKASQVASVTLDAIRIEDTDTVNPEYVMVSREVLTTPFVKTEGKTQEVEFTLEANV